MVNVIIGRLFRNFCCLFTMFTSTNLADDPCRASCHKFVFVTKVGLSDVNLEPGFLLRSAISWSMLNFCRKSCFCSSLTGEAGVSGGLGGGGGKPSSLWPSSSGNEYSASVLDKSERDDSFPLLFRTWCTSLPEAKSTSVWPSASSPEIDDTLDAVDSLSVSSSAFLSASVQSAFSEAFDVPAIPVTQWLLPSNASSEFLSDSNSLVFPSENNS